MDTTTCEGPRFLTTSEMALALGTSAATVRRWVKAGQLAAAQPAGRDGALRFPASELDRLAGGAR